MKYIYNKLHGFNYAEVKIIYTLGIIYIYIYT